MSTPPTGVWTPTGPQQQGYNQSSSSQSGFGQPPQTWMQRNWKKLVLGLVSLGVLAVVAFAAGIVGLVMWSFRNSDVCKLSIEQARKNPEVVARLGEPVQPGYFFSGSMSVNGDSGSATITIPVHGPKGKADMYVDARKAMGTWTFIYVVVKTPSGERITVTGDPNRQLEDSKKPDDTQF